MIVKTAGSTSEMCPLCGTVVASKHDKSALQKHLLEKRARLRGEQNKPEGERNAGR